jgi:hypothetical protein
MMSLSIIFHNQYGNHLPQQGWTKWGGARSGMLKEELEYWYCQNCGDKQISLLPSYMFPMDDECRDFVRVCSLCKAKAIVERLSKWFELKT